MGKVGLGEQMHDLHDFNFQILVLTRIFAAVLFGFGLGLERELTNKYAGLRTHILVCLGSCIFTILSIYAFPMAVDQTHPQAYGDPARIAAQILTGIGFIGGGTVLRHGSSVYGLTTAATLWVAASIGMACGTGLLQVGFYTTIVSVGVLVLIRSFERNVLPASIKNSKQFKMIATCTEENSIAVYDYIIEHVEYMHEINKKRVDKDGNTVRITAVIDINSKNPIQTLYKKFEKLEGLDSILIQENDD